MTQAHKLLRELIALPSVNPAFLPEGDPRSGELRVAGFLAATAGTAGLDVELREVVPGRPNLLARLAPSGPCRHRVLLAPHLDTVPADARQFSPTEKGGRLHGRGACDAKGSIAAMLSAVCLLARHGPRPARTEIVFVGLVDEENSQLGSRALAASGLKADLAVVGEPTNSRLVTAHKGDLWLELETRGTAAHGARPQLGRNAIHAMARVVEVIEGDYATQLRRRKHPLLGAATVNVGLIRGGRQPNIVPDHCAISIDRRTLPGETAAGVRREIQSLLRHRRLRATFTVAKGAECRPLETDPGHPFVRQFMRQLGQARPLGVHFFCDASVLAAGGIPSVVFGPGDIAQGHTADEWVSLRQLERAQQGLVKFLRSLP